MARRSETVSIALTPQEKEKWKAAVERTPFENLASFVRYSMEVMTEVILSVGLDEELEIVMMTQPRADGKRTISNGSDVTFLLDKIDGDSTYFWPEP